MSRPIGATEQPQLLDRQPPANSATAVERARLTDVFVTGIETRWMSVGARPIAIGASPAGARSVGP